ncbi:hypothetical protein EV715DRAFT_275520 [Schizophyllum commune]
MKFSLLATSLFASVALAVPSPRADGCSANGGACYSATHGFSYPDKEQYQRNLMSACTGDEAAVNGTGNLWGNKACVAVAASYNKIWPETVQGLAACKNMDIACQNEQPSLDYNIYAGIVGDCAWEPNGCPITQQNYIDFIYGALSDIGSADWPSSVDTLLSTGWQPILDWAKTGDTIPYTNFNDFLHYA